MRPPQRVSPHILNDEQFFTGQSTSPRARRSTLRREVSRWVCTLRPNTVRKVRFSRKAVKLSLYRERNPHVYPENNQQPPYRYFTGTRDQFYLKAENIRAINNAWELYQELGLDVDKYSKDLCVMKDKDQHIPTSSKNAELDESPKEESLPRARNEAELDKILTVGTDCSGMEPTIQALRKLGVSYSHLFGCDKRPQVKEFYALNFQPEVFYTDVANRSNESTAEVDLYVAGLPCQPFTRSKYDKWVEDPTQSSTVIYHVLDYIKTRLPRMFILENTKDFCLRRNGASASQVISVLRSFKTPADGKVPLMTFPQR